jgi:hypothetical protein
VRQNCKMDNPKELEGFRYVGDKRNQLVYEIKNLRISGENRRIAENSEYR